MRGIYKRELGAYFYSPIAYVFLTVLVSFFGLFFMLFNVLPTQVNYGFAYDTIPAVANFEMVLQQMILILLFVLPLLTMRLISEEGRQKTDQLLLTAPISTTEIVLAKYLSALTVFSISLGISLIYPLILSIIAEPDLRILLGVYLGFFLLGASFIAIGVFASSLTENQGIAGILGFFFILSMWLIQFVGDNIKNALLKKIFQWISLLKRFDGFSVGVITIPPLVYYLSIILVFLFLTTRTIEKRRWTEG
jgi:ABC-2 type transport system permease protein